MGIHHATADDVIERCDRLAQQSLRLRPGQSQLAAFDADGTLWGPDVAEILWKRLIAERALSPKAVAPLARAIRGCGAEPARDAYLDYATLEALHRSGDCSEETMARVMLQGLAGITEDDLYLHAARATGLVTELQAADLAAAGKMLSALREFGYRVIVVSASPRWVVEVAVGPLGVSPEDVIAGCVAVVDGVLTDGVLEPLPHGKGKVQAILRRFGVVPRVALGNTLGDLPMLEATSHLRVLVNPTDDLVDACEGIRGTTWAMGLIGAPGVTSTSPARRVASARIAGFAGAGDQPAGRPRPRRPSPQG
ncbi:MAG TPA: HAD family hydrolase [Candidatus Polarisedimenticolia bacterium]|nr:HAD family hydrolase [Candidatus Polarisedimenticolia bacterium]